MHVAIFAGHNTFFWHDTIPLNLATSALVEQLDYFHRKRYPPFTSLSLNTDHLEEEYPNTSTCIVTALYIEL